MSENLPNKDYEKKIEEIIHKFNPDKIYTHSEHDLNLDHRILYNATLTATRPISNCNVKEILSFEVPSSTEWNFSSNFSPNVFENIEKELSFKLKSIQAYETEVRKFPHPRSVESLESIARRWGSVSGFKAAEAFCIIRKLSS